MAPCPRRIESLEDLRDYVNETLCAYEELEVGAFRLSERVLMRAGAPCGIFFCLHGPRAVLFSAIWETDQNTVLFYRSSGERFLRVQLVTAPSLELMCA